jgi:hypothetical protein
MYYNGTPTFRIWIVGTKRLLGVYEIEVGDNPERPLMPESIWGLVGMMDHEVYADFEVCPLTEEEPHAMQMVCIESAQHVVKTAVLRSKNQAREVTTAESKHLPLMTVDKSRLHSLTLAKWRTDGANLR